ncbi:ATP-dependent helicase, partial [Nocardia nova]|nr:ATP-dependent helicase [Nocardia nova]
MLHGLWSPGSGLVLWRLPGSAAQPDADVGGELPDPLGTIARTARFRHRVRVLVAGDSGPEVVEVRGHALAPEVAARVLTQPLPDTAVAADLRFLAHAARGLRR